MEDTLPYSQVPDIGFYPEPAKARLYRHVLPVLILDTY
jgi:hypothetical protein